MSSKLSHLLSCKMFLLASIFFFQFILLNSAPVDQIKSDIDPNHHEADSINDLGLEYGRYLQEVVQVLEDDKDFAKKLENVSADHIKSGAIAQELNFVHHNIRSKLDELKRIELDRLRKLAKKEHDTKELGGGSYTSDGRKWRSVGGSNKKLEEFMSKFDHIDHSNPHSFEVQDLHKLIVKASKDLEEIDKQRKEEFKRYEMEKETQYRESLKNMTEEEKKVAIEKHDEMIKKHKQHPRVHHPGSKQQLEEVWEEQDHMPKEEFNPKIFFSLHDVNGDGYWDQEEVEALLSLEIKKMYDANNPEDDPNEMEEEYHRMREHIYKEADKNKDGLISLSEFIEFTQRADFERDEGWKGLDEQPVYNEDELKQFERKRQEYLQQQQQYGQYAHPAPGGYQPQYVHYIPQPSPHHPGPAYQVQGGYQQHPQGYYQAQPQFAIHPNGQFQPQHPNAPPPNPQFYNQQQQAAMHQAMQQQAAQHQAMQQQAYQQQIGNQQQIAGQQQPPINYNPQGQGNFGGNQPQGSHSMPPPAPNAQFGAPRVANPNLSQQQGAMNPPPVQGHMPPSAPQANQQSNQQSGHQAGYQPPNVYKT